MRKKERKMMAKNWSILLTVLLLIGNASGLKEITSGYSCRAAAAETLVDENELLLEEEVVEIQGLYMEPSPEQEHVNEEDMEKVVDTEAESEPETDTETMPEPEADTEAESEPETDTETVPEIEVETKPDSEVETGFEDEPEEILADTVGLEAEMEVEVETEAAVDSPSLYEVANTDDVQLMSLAGNQAGEAGEAKRQYSYKVIPLINCMDKMLYVQTDDPDPASFRLADYDSKYQSDGTPATFVRNRALYDDVSYENTETFRVSGGYLFKCDKGYSDGGTLMLQVKTEQITMNASGSY